ncbi:hypothetical protein GAY28_30165 [Azospirillum brasilense]|uniref:hypothetical protein n=1 Tax=Azospirillum brasilense TaxID=192 RepID=UPI000E68BBC8|nr:hypothetical protein [Azospirillum brasilense]NUB16397.1 hypothetical protein [Azospirillum brasilense]NUB29663.1 hypothetical protein [Azospirillum brasilense]NUB31405.1 hypothetical protein [Azospirillum brasilense]RIW03056.1 hypothetical protein D2T81_14340 [Azospirillum brasilense]
MWQDLLVAVVVALAAVWTVWRVILPAGLRARLLGRAAPKGAGCGGGCKGCGPAGGGSSCH